MKIKTKFDVKQKIFIPQLNVEGLINFLNIGVDGMEYNVRWFNNGSECKAYFLESELEEINHDKKVVGFGTG